MARWAAIGLTLLAVAWCAAVLAAPVTLAHGSRLFPLVVYEAAGLICHQRPERSFYLAGVQLPVCARCLGLYLSGTAGALAALVMRTPRPALPDWTRGVLLLAAVPTVATVVAEWSGLWDSTGAGRAIAALPLGLALGYLLVGALRHEGATAGSARQMRYHS